VDIFDELWALRTYNYLTDAEAAYGFFPLCWGVIAVTVGLMQETLFLGNFGFKTKL
jgi:hypothetical protein